MTRLILATFCLMLAASPALAETAVEAGDPLAPCTNGSASSSDITKSGPPWGVEIASSFDKKHALDEFARAKQDYNDIFADYIPMVVAVCNLSMGTDLRYSARVGMGSRDDADKLCAKLQAAGGACIVLKN